MRSTPSGRRCRRPLHAANTRESRADRSHGRQRIKTEQCVGQGRSATYLGVVGHYSTFIESMQNLAENMKYKEEQIIILILYKYLVRVVTDDQNLLFLLQSTLSDISYIFCSPEQHRAPHDCSPSTENVDSLFLDGCFREVTGPLPSLETPGSPYLSKEYYYYYCCTSVVFCAVSRSFLRFVTTSPTQEFHK